MTSRVASLSRRAVVGTDYIAGPAPVDGVAMASGEATMPSLIATLAGAGPTIDAEKILAIREAIAAGRYPVDAKAIAARMIALDLPMPSLEPI